MLSFKEFRFFIIYYFLCVLQLESRVEHLTTLAKSEPVRRSKVKVLCLICQLSLSFFSLLELKVVTWMLTHM